MTLYSKYSKHLLFFISTLLCLTACDNFNKISTPPMRVHTAPTKEVISPEIATGRLNKPLVTAKKFMVVSANPLASQAGHKILSGGGSAVDAAIAVQAVLNVVEPQSSGIGGGGFLLNFNKKNNSITAYDGRETAPASAVKTLFLDKNGQEIPFETAATGGKAVGVPALLKMLALAHKEQGKLPWKDLFTDAIYIANNGFPMSERLNLMVQSVPYYKKIGYNDFKRYLDKNDKIHKVGTLIYNKPLGDTFRKIAQNGADAFYTGAIANDIIQTVNKDSDKPIITLNDLKNYQPKKRDAVCTPYHTYRLCGMPPPSSGGVTVLQALKMLERFNLQDYDYYNPLHVHLTASSLRLAYADRSKYLSDPDFSAVPVSGLLSETYLRNRSELINPKKAFDIAPIGDPSEPITQFASVKTSEPPSTTHISIVDSFGNAVSFTSTIERAFGSGLATQSGFILNNQMTDFDFKYEKNGIKIANHIQAFKRPRSSMSPFFIFDSQGELSSVIGSPGGARIISYVFPRILSLIHSNKPIDTMVQAPNMTAMLPEAVIELEEGIDLKNLDTAMIKYGYTPIIRDLTSGIHLIHIKNGVLYGASDPRREGIALGE